MFDEWWAQHDPHDSLSASDRLFAQHVWEAATAELAAARERVKALEEALLPFARWYAQMGEENLDPMAVPAYRHAADALASPPAGGAT